MTSSQERKQTTEASPEIIEINGVNRKDFKMIIILKIIQEKVNKINANMEHFNTELGFKNQVDILELKNTVSEIHHSLHGFNSRLDTAKDQISFKTGQ